MKSKIKIDLDGSNNPVLRIELSNDSDDLRDKALRRFIEGIGYDSNALFIRHPNNIPHQAAFEDYQIYPYIRLSEIPQWQEHAHIMFRIDAEQLLAKALNFEAYEYAQKTGFTVWKDSEGCLWRFEKYGFGKLDRHANDQITYKSGERTRETEITDEL